MFTYTYSVIYCYIIQSSSELVACSGIVSVNLTDLTVCLGTCLLSRIPLGICALQLLSNKHCVSGYVIYRIPYRMPVHVEIGQHLPNLFK